MFKNDVKAEEMMKRARANYEKVKQYNRWKQHEKDNEKEEGI